MNKYICKIYFNSHTTDIFDVTNIPVRIALLFKDIHENKGVLPIKCHCPRMGVKDSAPSTPVIPPSLKSNSEVEQRDVGEPNNETEQKAADSRYCAFLRPVKSKRTIFEG